MFSNTTVKSLTSGRYLCLCTLFTDVSNWVRSRAHSYPHHISLFFLFLSLSLWCFGSSDLKKWTYLIRINRTDLETGQWMMMWLDEILSSHWPFFPFSLCSSHACSREYTQIGSVCWCLIMLDPLLELIIETHFSCQGCLFIDWLRPHNSSKQATQASS